MPSRPHHKPPFPSREDVVAFIGREPGKVGTREIARAFGLKNDDRAALKRMLRELADEGVVERRRKKLHHAGTLPSVVMADVTSHDQDGDLIAAPQEWDEELGLPQGSTAKHLEKALNGTKYSIGLHNHVIRLVPKRSASSVSPQQSPRLKS